VPDAGANVVDLPPEPVWESMVTVDWSLEAGTEDYFCARKTLTETVYVTAFRSLVADDPAVHHGFLSVTAPGGDASMLEPDGVTRCTGATLGTVAIAGSAPGFNGMDLPEGVAVKIDAGAQLLFNVHLYNTTTEGATGTTGMEVVTVSPDEVQQVAEILIAGKLPSLMVPPGESTHTGTCTLPGETTIFAAAPHMHKLGTYLSARALPASGEPLMLLDGPYSFEDQGFSVLQAPIHLQTGDTIEVNCTYQNPFEATIPFGQSSDQEMCMAGLFLYPPISTGNAFCFND
jgi:hypothetical protein